MTIRKDCADHLRQYVSAAGNKLRATHAHELVAAFFGYGTAAGLQAENKYPIEQLPEADILVPDEGMLHQRTQDIAELPDEVRDIDQVVSVLCNFLQANGHFSGEVWLTENLAEYVKDDYLPTHHMLTIMDELSGEMAETNASFDGPDFDEATIESDDDGVKVIVTGVLEGDTDLDRPFSGDKINFTSKVAFDRVAGRVAFRNPDISAGGSVDDSYYDGD